MVKTDDHIIKIFSSETTSGFSLLTVPFNTADGIIIPVHYPEYHVDFDEIGIDPTKRVGGIMDGITTLDPENQYHVWSFADENFIEKGFGLMAIPKSVYTSTAYAKGTTAALTGVTKAYRFTVGSRVRIIEDDTVGTEVWNLGTVRSITSATAMTVQLDNSADYGTALTATTGVSVEQMDNFKPYFPNDSNQQVYYPHYRIIGQIELLDDTGDPIRRIYSYPIHHFTFPAARTLFYRSGVSGLFSGTVNICKMFLPEKSKSVNISLYALTANVLTYLIITNPISASIDVSRTPPTGINEWNFMLDESFQIDYEGSTATSSIVEMALIGWFDEIL